MNDKKPLDIVIFGATGYTGKYVIRESLKILNGFKWAVAGRNRQKLETALAEIGKEMSADLSKTPIIVADVADEQSVKKMASQCKVIINCCGPYQLYGEIVVKACIDAGTSHIDISGEPVFFEKMQLKYSQLAREAGVYIISACGLESIPVEMGINFMESKFNGTINSVDSYLRMFMDKGFRSTGASINSGTYFSAVEAVANFPEMFRIRRQLYSSPQPELRPSTCNRLIHKNKFNGKSLWCIPLIEPDPSIVRQSQMYFYETSSKRPVQIHSYMVINRFYQVIGALMIGLLLILMAPLKFTRQLLYKYPEFFSFGVFSNAGPKQALVESTNFEVILVGRGWKEGTDLKSESPNKTMKVKIGGKNPAYGFTAAAMCCVAKTILLEKDKMPDNGGVMAPAAAFKNTNLIEELKLNRMTIEVISEHE